MLTEDGQRLFVHAEQMESAVHSARENLSGIGQALSGHLRIGATEGFGSYVLTPLAADFQRRYPHITLDILPVPRFVSLSKREADLAITIERPRGYVCSKLCDYTLRLYGTPGYLARHPPIRSRADLADHTFIGYVDELLFSERLRYLEDLLPASKVILRSTSVVAQYHAALQGQSLAILPCFIAAQDPGSRRCWNRRWRSRARSGCTATRTCASSSASTCCGSSSANRRCAMPACWPAPPCATCPKAGSRQGLRSRGLLRGAFTRSRRISRKNVSSATRP